MRQLVNPRHKELSVRSQTELLEIPRSTLYYKPIGESPENLEIMQKMDKHHIEHPTCGVLGMQDMLRLNGFQINHKRIRRLMRLMNIRVKYPQKSLSNLGARKYILPYLLRGLDIVKTNQVWSIDISYIPMKQGFMYLTAIMDVRSRYIVGWSLSNTLEKSVCLDLVEESIRKYGAPEIINSDQGVQFTNPSWIETLKENGIKISMDGKGRAKDNIWIERFWRTIKQEYVYLNPCDDGLELYKGIRKYMQYYNYNRAHQGIGRQIPGVVYKTVA